jgi:hypothetical protein
MLPASLDCPFLIAPSVFSDVYFIIKLPVWDVFPQFQQYFSFILLFSFIGGEKITRRRLQTNKSLTSLWKKRSIEYTAPCSGVEFTTLKLTCFVFIIDG